MKNKILNFIDINNNPIKYTNITQVNNKVIERVHPSLVLKNSYIANINGVLNAIIIDGQPVGRTILQGEGAGPGATCSALISDLCSVLRGNVKYPFGISHTLRKNMLHSSSKMMKRFIPCRIAGSLRSQTPRCIIF